MSEKRRRFGTGGRLASIALGALAIAWLTAPAFAADKIVKVGILAQLTGKASADAQQSVQGAQWAIDEANKAGGIAGYKFQLEIADVKDGAAADVTSAAQRLLGDPDIHFMMTGYANLTGFEVDLMKEADMPYMLEISSKQLREIISADPSQYWCCWSITPSFDGYGTGVLPFVEKLEADGKLKLKNHKIAVITSDNEYSRTIAEKVKELFAAAGWTITLDEMVPYGEVTDWGSILAKIRQDQPAFIMNTDYLPGNSASFLNQFMEQPTDSLVFLQYAPAVPEFTDLTGSRSTGVVYDLLGSMVSTLPISQKLMGEFKERYEVESGPYGVGLYWIMQIYFDALKKVGDPTKHEEIGLAIGQTDVLAPQGRMKFDPNTHLTIQDDQHLPLLFFQIRDGKRVLIGPSQYAEGDFQLPPWMKK